MGHHIYKPGWQARIYRTLSAPVRETVAGKVDRLFRERTGVTRHLNPTNQADLELRRTWLRIRDEVVDSKLEEWVEADRMDSMLTSIPGEMEHEGWPEAAQLLETWFERTPATAPGYSAPVTGLIKMDWVLRFARAREVYDAMIREKIWTNDASKKRLAAIAKQGAGPAAGRWWDLSRPVTTVDQRWVNARPVKSGWSWDALAGALGSFELQLAIDGVLIPVPGGKWALNIDEVGIYVKDSFDFNGEQFLGFWGYRDDPVNNSDFRGYRARNGAGGDFMVFSDVKRTKLNPTDVVILPI